MTFAIPRKFSPLVEKLLKRWRPKQAPPRNRESPAEPPLGLEVQQVAALRLLLQSPHWRHYSQLLETVTLNNVEQLLHPMSHDQYLFYTGVVFACRRIINLPDEILAKVANLEDHAHARTESQAAHKRARADAFLNTPFWDGYVADDGASLAADITAAAKRSYTDLG